MIPNITLALDIGGVLMDRLGRIIPNFGDFPLGRASFSDSSFLSVNEIPEAIKWAHRLQSYFGEIVIISKCKGDFERKTLRYFDHHHIYNRIGISSRDIFFCRERWEKVAYCERIRPAAMIDDRLETLWYIRHAVPNLFLFQYSGTGTIDPREVDALRETVHPKDGEFVRFLERITVASTWPDLAEQILNRIPPQH